MQEGLVFMGWVISWLLSGRIIYLGEGVRISSNWATTHFLTFQGQPVMGPVGVLFSIC